MYLGEIISSNMKLIQEAYAFEEEKRPQSFEKFDQLIVGVRDGDLLVIDSESSSHATSFFISSMLCSLIPNKKKVLYFTSIESPEELGFKIISASTGLSIANLKSGRLVREDFKTLMKAFEKILCSTVQVEEWRSDSIASIFSKASEEKQSKRLDLILIDGVKLYRGVGFEPIFAELKIIGGGIIRTSYCFLGR